MSRAWYVCIWLCCSCAAHPAWGILIGDNKEIYFCDLAQQTVWVWRDGELSKYVTGVHTHELVDDSAGHLLGVHSYYQDQTFKQEIWSMDRQGRPAATDVIISPNQWGLSFQHPQWGDIWFDFDASSRQFNLQNKQGSLAVAPLSNLQAVWLSNSGELYVTTGDAVQRLDAGTWSSCTNAPLPGYGARRFILGLTQDAQDNLLVADYDYHVVLKILPSGDVHEQIDTGWWWSPTGVAVDEGDIYVLQHCGPGWQGILAALRIGPYLRIQKFSASGVKTTLITISGERTYLFWVGMILVVLASIAWRIVSKRKVHSN